MQKIVAFFTQFNVTKHTITVGYATLYTLFQTNVAFRAYALSIYGLFPHWLSALIVGLVVPLITFYHIGANSTVATAIKQAAPAALLLLSLMTFGLLTGCTPTTTNAAVKNIVAYLPTVKALADEGISIDQLFDPANQASAAATETTINNVIASVTAIANTYLAAPTPTNWQSVVNAVDALVTNADAQLLAASRITNPNSEAKATAILGAVDLAVHALDAFIQQAQPTAAVKATASARTTKLKSVAAYWPSREMTPTVIGELRTYEAMGF